MSNQWGDRWQPLGGLDTRTECLQAPHGWLVRVICEHTERMDQQANVSMCFVPDLSESQAEPEQWRQVADRLATALEGLLKKRDRHVLRLRDPEMAVISTALAIYRRAVTDEHEDQP